MAKRKRRASARPGFVEYYVQIDSWEACVGLGVGYPRLPLGPYHSSYSIDFWGRFLTPEKAFGATIHITLYPDWEVSQALREKPRFSEPAERVGFLTGVKKHGRPWATLKGPLDWFSGIFTLLSTERIRFLIMSGNPLLRGEAILRNWDFIRALNSDDHPGVEELPPQESSPHAHVHEDFVPRPPKRSKQPAGEQGAP